MLTLQRRGFFRRKVALKALDGLKADDFRKLAGMLGVSPIKARKIGYVAAKKAEKRQVIETRWNGKETQITAEPGDWIVTTLSPAAKVLLDAEGSVNTYAIKPEKFTQLYEPAAGVTEYGSVFRAKGVVEALFLSGGFEIKAPWGETQRAKAGYLLLNGDEVYGNNRDVFDATYAVLR